MLLFLRCKSIVIDTTERTMNNCRSPKTLGLDESGRFLRLLNRLKLFNEVIEQRNFKNCFGKYHVWHWF